MDLSNPEVASVESKFDVVQTTQVLVDQPQLTPLQFRPSSVRQQAVGDLITGDVASTGVVRVPDATTNISTFTVTDVHNRGMLAPAEAQILVNGFTWPSAAFAMGNFPVSVFNNYGISDGINLVLTVACRNNSGATVDLQVTAYFRIITNNSPEPPSATGMVAT